MGFARRAEKELLKRDVASLGKDVLSRADREAYAKEATQPAVAAGRSLWGDVSKQLLGTGGGASSLVQGQAQQAQQAIQEQVGQVGAQARKQALDMNRQLREARRQELLSRLAARGSADWQRARFWMTPVVQGASQVAGQIGSSLGSSIGSTVAGAGG